jgi:hypothetical protein
MMPFDVIRLIFLFTDKAVIQKAAHANKQLFEVFSGEYFWQEKLTLTGIPNIPPCAEYIGKPPYYLYRKMESSSYIASGIIYINKVDKFSGYNSSIYCRPTDNSAALKPLSHLGILAHIPNSVDINFSGKHIRIKIKDIGGTLEYHINGHLPYNKDYYFKIPLSEKDILNILTIYVYINGYIYDSDEDSYIGINCSDVRDTMWICYRYNNQL